MNAGQVDYYAIDELLSEDERITQASVRSFIEREALPVIEGCHAREEFPRDLIRRMAALGVFRANLQGYGCAGLSNVAYGLMMMELEAGDSGLRSMGSVQGSLAMYAIWRWGSEEQKRRWLPAMAARRAIGAARTCYLTALRYAQDRRQFDRPIAGYQLVQQKLVHMVTEITKGQLLAWRLGRLKDANTMRPEQVSLAKRANVAAALDIARLARDILGANGIVNEYPVIRHMMNLETVITYEGTHDMHTLILGRDITGLDAIR